jgi:hypothetical protein
MKGHLLIVGVHGQGKAFLDRERLPARSVNIKNNCAYNCDRNYRRNSTQEELRQDEDIIPIAGVANINHRRGRFTG